MQYLGTVCLAMNYLLSLSQFVDREVTDESLSNEPNKRWRVCFSLSFLSQFVDREAID
jgi:hypothetical protein